MKGGILRQILFFYLLLFFFSSCPSPDRNGMSREVEGPLVHASIPLVAAANRIGAAIRQRFFFPPLFLPPSPPLVFTDCVGERGPAFPAFAAKQICSTGLSPLPVVFEIGSLPLRDGRGTLGRIKVSFSF